MTCHFAKIQQNRIKNTLINRKQNNPKTSLIVYLSGCEWATGGSSSSQQTTTGEQTKSNVTCAQWLGAEGNQRRLSHFTKWFVCTSECGGA